MDKTLIMMVGLPRSGKTTKAKALAREHRAPIVSPDNIRLALHGHPFIASAEPFVWATAKLMVRSLFYDYDTVILDACNNTRERRDEWRNRKVGSGWVRRYEVLTTDVETCRSRVDGDEALADVIERMAAASESVEEDESD